MLVLVVVVVVGRVWGLVINSVVGLVGCVVDIVVGLVGSVVDTVVDDGSSSQEPKDKTLKFVYVRSRNQNFKFAKFYNHITHVIY